MAQRYILQQSRDLPNWWVLTDIIEGVVIRFEEHKFNETQRVTILDESNLQHDPDAANKVAHIVQEMGKWLYRCHYSIAMPTPVYELQEDEDADKLYIIRHKPPRLRIEILDDVDNAHLASALRKCAEWLTKGREFRWRKQAQDYCMKKGGR